MSAGAPRPYPVSFRLSRANRNSVAALLAVLEAELPAGLARPELLRAGAAFDGRGLYVGSFMTEQAVRVAAEMSGLRARLGDALHAVAGGPHASALPADALRMGFTWAVPGEAGPAFAGLVRALAAGSVPVPGVLGPDEARPLDAWDPWPRSGQLFASIELTRGCPRGCAFCQTPRLFGREPRHRSLAALRRVFAHAVETGHRYTRFVAPDAFAWGVPAGSPPDARALEALLTTAREAGFTRVYLGTFPSEVRPESVTDEALRVVRDLADNRTLAIGLQSGSDAVLRAIRRGHTVAQGVEAVARAARAGFVPKVDVIFGLPGETEADARATRAVIEHLIREFGAKVHGHVFAPLPGTPLADAPPGRVGPGLRDFLGGLAGARLLTGDVALQAEPD